MAPTCSVTTTSFSTTTTTWWELRKALATITPAPIRRWTRAALLLRCVRKRTRIGCVPCLCCVPLLVVFLLLSLCCDGSNRGLPCILTTQQRKVWCGFCRCLAVHFLPSREAYHTSQSLINTTTRGHRGRRTAAILEVLHVDVQYVQRAMSSPKTVVGPCVPPYRATTLYPLPGRLFLELFLDPHGGQSN